MKSGNMKPAEMKPLEKLISAGKRDKSNP